MTEILNNLTAWVITAVSGGAVGITFLIRTFYKFSKENKQLKSLVSNLENKLNTVFKETVKDTVLPFVDPFVDAGNEILVSVKNAISSFEELKKEFNEIKDNTNKLIAITISLSPTIPAVKEKAIEIFGQEQLVSTLIKTSINQDIKHVEDTTKEIETMLKEKE